MFGIQKIQMSNKIGLRSITKFTLFQFYKSENLYYKLQVQVQVQLTSGEE